MQRPLYHILAALTGIAASFLAFSSGLSHVRADEGPTVIRDVVYVQRGEISLHADIYVPEGDGPFPGVLLVHGGGWMSGNKSHMNWHGGQLARGGYTAVAIDYRLAPKWKFPAQIEDCKEAVRWMRKNTAKYKIDASRIAGYGYSAGGHLVCLLGTTDPSAGLEGSVAAEESGLSTRLQAVVAGGAPCDFRQFAPDNKRLAYWLGGSRQEKPEAYRLASPATFVSKDDPPTWFYHGANDRLVPQASPQKMARLLQGAGIRAEVHIVADTGHIRAFLDRSVPPKAMVFLDEVLKGE